MVARKQGFEMSFVFPFIGIVVCIAIAIYFKDIYVD